MSLREISKSYEEGALSGTLEAELTTGMSKQEKLKHLAQSITLEAERLEDLGAKTERLQPPKTHLGLHNSYIRFFNGGAKLTRKWADLVSNNDLTRARAMSLTLAEFDVASYKKIIADMEALGLDTVSAKKILADQERAVSDRRSR